MRAVADQARLDTTSDRTSLSAATGSPLADFLAFVATRWSARELFARAELVPAIMFVEGEYCAEVERQVLISLWHKLAETGSMPLAQPGVQWEAVPDFVSLRRKSEPEVTDLAELPRHPIAPGDTLPEGYMAQCIGSVLALPLAGRERAISLQVPLPRTPGDTLAELIGKQTS